MKLEITTEKGLRLTRVTEAAIQINDGEDLRELVMSIGDGAKNAVRTLLAPQILIAQNQGNSGPWLCADKVFADVAIIESEWYRGGKCEETYYRVPWSRGADGAFTFGQAEQVEEVTTYVPVTPPALTAPVPAPAMEALNRAAHISLGLIRQSVILGGTSLRADAERTAESLLREAPAGEFQPVREALSALRSGDRTKVLQLTAALR